jgi:hypothetical protein
METCKRCNKPLKTAQSVKDGYGAICKRKQEAADAEFEKRQVTIDEVLDYQEKSKR